MGRGRRGTLAFGFGSGRSGKDWGSLRPGEAGGRLATELSGLVLFLGSVMDQTGTLNLGRHCRDESR